MKPGMKMLLISNRGNDNSRYDRSENDMESRYRDSRGREHYESGRYAPKGNYDGMESNYPMTDNYGMEGRYNDDAESRRRRDIRGRFRSDMDEEEMRMGTDDMESRRRRDSRGRFRSEWDGMESRREYGRNEMDEMKPRNGGYSNYGNEARMGGYPNRPFPVYEDGRSNMNQIGFNAGGGEVRTNYGMNATHHTGNEMDYKVSPKMGGGYSSGMSMPMNKEMAEEWTSKMKNEDGTKGPHWKMEQVKQLMAQKGIEANPFEFFAILNAMYSDYCAVFKKHGVNTMDMYVDLACAFLNDSDAMPNKAALYYECIVKK